MPFTVPAFKKRNVLLLAVIALGSGLIVVCLGGSASDRVEPGRPAPGPNSAGAERNGDAGSEPVDNSNSFGELSYEPGSGIYSDLLRAILFVVVLGAAAIYASRKLLPKITNLPGKEVRVVETVYLGPRKAVHVLEVGSRRFLVGSTNENITKLADITDELAQMPVQEVGYN
jgi:hypothetical protein